MGTKKQGRCISLPAELWARVDTIAAKRGATRSATIARMLARVIAAQDRRAGDRGRGDV